MTLYFTGLDLQNCVISIQDKSSQSQLHCGVLQAVNNNLKNVHMRFDFMVFQKDKTEDEIEKGSWYIKGEGILGERTLFDSYHDVSQVCLTANSVVGLNDKTNSLYIIDFSLNYDTPEYFQWRYKKIVNTSIQIKQIVTNTQSVFVLDSSSRIYEVSSDTLILKWRMEEVEIVKLCCGFGHFVALSDTGALYSWGSGGRGELGHFENDHVMVNCDHPKRIEFFDDLPCIVKDISCGGWHTLVLTSDGDIYSFGWNESGQLGHSGEKMSSVGGVPYPVDLGSGDDPVVQISAGARHSLAALKSGKCYSWGLNKHGQLGLGDFDNRNEPVEIQFDIGQSTMNIECDRWCTFFYIE